MNKRLPHWVDPRKFAHQAVLLEGQIAEQDLPRLAKAVASIDAPVRASLRFDIDESRFRTLSGTLTATVSTTCQRCMELTQLEIRSELAVGVVGNEDESRHLPRYLEPWQVEHGETEADLYELIEDELLLGLPMVVYHDFQCIDEELYSTGDAESAAAPESKPKPFQVLEQLKGGKNK